MIQIYLLSIYDIYIYIFHNCNNRNNRNTTQIILMGQLNYINFKQTLNLLEDGQLHQHKECK